MPDPSYAALDALAERAGYEPLDPPILQPADLFLDLLGEDMRRRAFLTTDAEGREFCLRPDFTIPVSLHHLKHAAAGAVGAYAYRGPVFRFRTDGPGEFAQAGFENFGRTDLEAADAEMLGLAIEAVQALGLESPEIRMGDAGIVTAMLDALALPPVWRRQLANDVLRVKNLDADLARLGETTPKNGAAAYAGFLAALEGADPGAARAAVADLLSIAGIQPVGGRTVDEVADRFLEQAALSSGGGIPAETVALTRRLFAVAGDPDSASAALRAIAADARLDLGAALDAFDRRTGFFAAQGVDVGAVKFSTAFGRRLDYYTGFVFELHDPARPEGPQLVGGGRYDRLMTRLGAPAPIPAVGCSIWLDRFAGETP
ncbi:ATP phosphoribosyltransferase regulatory subunit [Labrys wisconsinensis]|uniref:ATP phosphoribosyltransferase regulatory subunit n=1 Tax=Labrys wisconsinensis TaxID=425677 RepID=A0ABU0JL30_9HYPH|nr:ATP phosphoribosyltransferase regulatory subunit [Labrys wisconsinensis]MDQ0474995.1 ATP phosphoribosyltransferase regulatory subunit [Labrys wisconsinensis]